MPVLLPAPTSAPVRLKVGVYISRLTGQRWGYSCQIAGELAHRQFDLIPLLEPGSSSEPEVVKLLGVYFGGRSAIDVTDAAALKKLDVIVAPRIWNLPDEARAAIEAAVTQGTGLLIRNGLGCMEPGGGSDVSRLSGFTESAFGYNPHPMECQVIAAHPILGNLSPQIGRVIMITPNGTWGRIGSGIKPLIRVKDMDSFRRFWKEGPDDLVFYPLYAGELGRGRIIGCQFPAWEPMPKALMAATHNEFNARAVLWLARRLEGSDVAPSTATQPKPR
jgi:hypothetical protein